MGTNAGLWILALLARRKTSMLAQGYLRRWRQRVTGELGGLSGGGRRLLRE